MAAAVILGLLVGVGFGAAWVWVLYRFTLRREIGTRATNCTLLHLLPCAGLGALIGVLLAIGGIALRHRPGAKLIWLIFPLIAWACWGYVPARWPSQRRAAGRMQLNLGWRRPRQQLYAVVIGLIVLGLMVALPGLSRGAYRTKSLVPFLVDVPLVVYLAFTWRTGVRVCENGILTAGNLVRWRQIVGYEWENDGLTLTLRVKRRFQPVWPLSFGVEPRQRDVLQAILANRVDFATPPLRYPARAAPDSLVVTSTSCDHVSIPEH